MSPNDKPLVWLAGAVKSPPFSADARMEAGFLLRRLQMGEAISLPHSRPMPTIGRGCHELRIVDADTTWRLVYAIDDDAIVILGLLREEDPSHAEPGSRSLPPATEGLPERPKPRRNRWIARRRKSLQLPAG